MTGERIWEEHRMRLKPLPTKLKMQTVRAVVDGWHCECRFAAKRRWWWPWIWDYKLDYCRYVTPPENEAACPDLAFWRGRAQFVPGHQRGGSDMSAVKWDRWHELLDIKAERALTTSEEQEYQEYARIAAQLDAEEGRAADTALDNLVKEHERVLDSIRRLKERLT